MQSQIDIFSHHEGVLLEWVALRRTFFPSKVVSFEPCHALIGAARPYLSERLGDFKKALAKSSSLLAPLADPLEMNLGVHRWLRGQREERYTDWLHWVVEHIDTAELLRVLGIDLPDVMLPDRVTRSADCEVWVAKGHEGHAGRLDLVIDFPNEMVVIVIEVKTSGGGNVVKHGGYVESIDKIHKKYSKYKSKKFVFLTPDPEDNPNAGLSDARFRVLLWCDLCLRLRCHVKKRVKRIKDRNLCALAMILAFVGAVEQNLLGYTDQAAVSSGNPMMLNTKTIDYLHNFTGGNQ